MSAPERRLRNLVPAPPPPPGNGRAITHAAYSSRLAPRAAELADQLRALVPTYTASDEPAVRRLAAIEARIEAASAWLDDHGLLDSRGRARPIVAPLTGWENTAVRMYAALGLTPLARSQLGVNIVTAAGTAAALSDRREALEKLDQCARRPNPATDLAIPNGPSDLEKTKRETGTADE